MEIRRFFPLLGLIIFALAAYLLHQALRQYSLQEIVDSIMATSLWRLAAAGFFVACSYFSLSLFDFLGTRYVGARLPYPKVALASFSALSVGHTLGLAALSSGAIRYRFYSRWNVPASDIANIILFCAVTVGLGLNTLGAAAFLLRSEIAADLLGIGAGAARAIGFTCLALDGVYVLAALSLRRPLHIKGWEASMPRPGLALAQICVGAMNFAFVAAALHQALLSTTQINYLAVATVYVVGNVAWILSHVPGGLGVFETVVIYLIPQPGAIGALVVFRVLYFLVPFVLGGLLFAATEINLRLRTG